MMHGTPDQVTGAQQALGSHFKDYEGVADKLAEKLQNTAIEFKDNGSTVVWVSARQWSTIVDMLSSKPRGAGAQHRYIPE